MTEKNSNEIHEALEEAHHKLYLLYTRMQAMELLLEKSRLFSTKDIDKLQIEVAHSLATTLEVTDSDTQSEQVEPEPSGLII